MFLSLLFAHRRKCACLFTVAAALLLLAVPWRLIKAAAVIEPEHSITVQLAPTPEPVPEQPKPQPVPEPQKPEKVTPKEVVNQPVPKPQPVVTKTETAVAPLPEAPAANAKDVVAAAAPQVAPAIPEPVKTTPPPVEQPAVAANTNANFADKIRQLINNNKAYPTGREASIQKPEGTVEVCVVIARNGEYVDANVKESSGSIILDQAGKRLVSRLRYPAFEDTAFKGQAQHEFCVRLKYEVPKN